MYEGCHRFGQVIAILDENPHPSFANQRYNGSCKKPIGSLSAIIERIPTSGERRGATRFHVSEETSKLAAIGSQPSWIYSHSLLSVAR